MVKLPGLVDAVALWDGRSRPSIEHIARMTRDAGFIPKGKRGLGGPEMSDEHAANLLIALNGTETPDQISRRIPFWRSLEAGTLFPSFIAAPAVPEFAELKAASNFGAALEALILRADPIITWIAKQVAKTDWAALKQDMLIPVDARARISVSFVYPIATIDISYEDARHHKRNLYRCFFTPGPALVDSGQRPGRRLDRIAEVRIGAPTLVALWAALHSDLPPEHYLLSVVDPERYRA